MASRTFPRRDRSSSARSEEHTSELQSQSNLVCRLLLEKKTPQPFEIPFGGTLLLCRCGPAGRHGGLAPPPTGGYSGISTSWRTTGGHRASRLLTRDSCQ